MTMKEESAFLQGVESRLDSLFAEDDQQQKKESTKPAPTEIGEPSATDGVPTPEGLGWAETTTEQTESPVDDAVSLDGKSKFMSDIEKRFETIFGPDATEAGNVIESDEQNDLKTIIDEAAPESVDFLEHEEDLTMPSSAVYSSPLKDMKSIVLSIEWEINEENLEQLEDEINKLYLLYTGDRIIQGFLRILRFLGRYIRVRGTHTSQDSANLLLSIYDQFEKVMVPEEITEPKKHAIFVDSIKEYRAWAAHARLDAEEEAVPYDEVDEERSQLAPSDEPWEHKAVIEEPQQRATQVEVDQSVQLTDEAIIDEEPQEEPALELSTQAAEPIVETLESPVHDEATGEDLVATAQTQPPETEQDIASKVAAMKDMPPHEAFVYAIEEIKKSFQEELDALKEEIRLLKGAL